MVDCFVKAFRMHTKMSNSDCFRDLVKLVIYRIGFHSSSVLKHGRYSYGQDARLSVSTAVAGPDHKLRGLQKPLRKREEICSSRAKCEGKLTF